MIHELDLICWMTGERPKSVMVYGHAHGQIFQEMNDVDGACIMMKFPSGCIGFIEKFRGSTYGFDDRYEVGHEIEGLTDFLEVEIATQLCPFRRHSGEEAVVFSMHFF